MGNQQAGNKERKAGGQGGVWEDTRAVPWLEKRMNAPGGIVLHVAFNSTSQADAAVERRTRPDQWVTLSRRCKLRPHTRLYSALRIWAPEPAARQPVNAYTDDGDGDGGFALFVDMDEAWGRFWDGTGDWHGALLERDAVSMADADGKYADLFSTTDQIPAPLKRQDILAAKALSARLSVASQPLPRQRLEPALAHFIFDFDVEWGTQLGWLPPKHHDAQATSVFRDPASKQPFLRVPGAAPARRVDLTDLGIDVPDRLHRSCTDERSFVADPSSARHLLHAEVLGALGLGTVSAADRDGKYWEQRAGQRRIPLPTRGRGPLACSAGMITQDGAALLVIAVKSHGDSEVVTVRVRPTQGWAGFDAEPAQRHKAAGDMLVPTIFGDAIISDQHEGPQVQQGQASADGNRVLLAVGPELIVVDQATKGVSRIGAPGDSGSDVALVGHWLFALRDKQTLAVQDSNGATAATATVVPGDSAIDGVVAVQGASVPSVFVYGAGWGRVCAVPADQSQRAVLRSGPPGSARRFVAAAMLGNALVLAEVENNDLVLSSFENADADPPTKRAGPLRRWSPPAATAVWPLRPRAHPYARTPQPARTSDDRPGLHRPPRW